MNPELCGSFTFWHAHDRTRRQWYVWATLDETGTLDHIHLGISQILANAQGPLTQSDCTTPLYYRAWQYAAKAAEDATWSGEADVVIDLYDD